MVWIMMNLEDITIAIWKIIEDAESLIMDLHHVVVLGMSRNNNLAFWS